MHLLTCLPQQDGLRYISNSRQFESMSVLGQLVVSSNSMCINRSACGHMGNMLLILLALRIKRVLNVQDRLCQTELKSIKVYDRMLTRLFKAQTGESMPLSLTVTVPFIELRVDAHMSR
jgi:hypothetical protein